MQAQTGNILGCGQTVKLVDRDQTVVSDVGGARNDDFARGQPAIKSSRELGEVPFHPGRCWRRMARALNWLAEQYLTGNRITVATVDEGGLC